MHQASSVIRVICMTIGWVVDTDFAGLGSGLLAAKCRLAGKAQDPKRCALEAGYSEWFLHQNTVLPTNIS